MDRRSFYKSAFGAVLGCFGVKAKTQAEEPRFYSMLRGGNRPIDMDYPPLSQSEINRIHAEWESEFQGLGRGKLIITRPGMTLKQWGPKVLDSCVQESMR